MLVTRVVNAYDIIQQLREKNESAIDPSVKQNANCIVVEGGGG